MQVGAGWRSVRAAGVALAAMLALAPRAAAADLWTQTGSSITSVNYWQGITFAPASGAFFFDGLATGLWRTDAALRRTAGRSSGIPSSVRSAEGWNHLGDLSFDATGGGRLLVPLECYWPGAPDPNTCKTGGFGVVDPTTLAWRYYVKLDPTQIAKAMWVEASPDGLLWTSSGNDLLAYRAADVNPANAAPAAAPIHSVRRLAGAVPPSGVTGAAFQGGRLFLSGAQGTTYQIWSVNLATGARRLEVELKNVQGEAEGLHITSLLGGTLHFLVAPLAQKPTFGPSVGLLHFTRAGRPGLRVSARATRTASHRPRVSVKVTRRGAPVEGATVTVAGKRARTNAKGAATLKPVLDVAGRFAAIGRKGRLEGRSRFLQLGPAAAAGSAAGSAALR